MTSRSVDEHRDAVAGLLAPLAAGRAVESLPISAARLAAHPEAYRARILAADVRSPIDLPPFDNSQMDGYAVASRALSGATDAAPVRLSVAQQIPAGNIAQGLEPGTAAPIMTGAPLPSGADAVVPIERVEPARFLSPDEQREQSVAFSAETTPETYVRRRGSDVRAGDVLLAAGARLGPAQFGVIAGVGLTSVFVLRRPRVLLVSTGHEIREAGTHLEPGQIYDSNSVALTRALADCGCTVVAWPCRSDNTAELTHILRSAGPTADLVITVGGVSAGAHEVVRDVFAPLGVEFGPVAMQPGGPQGLGEVTIPGTDHRIPVLTFPGNPVSALVSFELFVRPILLRLGGHPRPEREKLRAPLAEAVDSPAEKHQVRRGALDDEGRVRLIGGPSSHLLQSYAASSVLVHLPVGLAHADAGDDVEVWRIDV